MSDQQMMGFGKFVPGFDFLQNLAKGTSQAMPQMATLSSWVAPTLNVEELDKRIGELKAVHFWLDQNSKALGATIQALEVQKMTLATLKGMNFNMAEVANALKLQATDAMTGAASKPADAEPAAAAAKKSPARKKATGDTTAPQAVDPMQWWGALTQQFQQIAASAMKDTATQAAVDTAKSMATGIAKEALKTATGAARSAGGAARKRATRPRK